MGEIYKRVNKNVNKYDTFSVNGTFSIFAENCPRLIGDLVLIHASERAFLLYSVIELIVIIFTEVFRDSHYLLTEILWKKSYGESTHEILVRFASTFAALRVAAHIHRVHMYICR